MSTFNIDFFELAFLAETCIPPVPIARNSFWNDLINKHYKTMSKDERLRLFDWITKESRFDLKNEECQLFYDRYNPDNQYLIDIVFQNIPDKIETFKVGDKYYTEKNKFISEEFIQKIEKL